MARKGRKHKRQARRQALDAAAAAAVAKPSTPPPTSPNVTAAPAPAPSADETQPVRVVREPVHPPAASTDAAVPGADTVPARRRRRAAVWPLVGVAAAAVFGLAVIAAFLLDGQGQQAAASPSAEIVVGMPGGEIVSQETPAATASPTEQPTLTPEPTPAATPRPTPVVTPTTRPAASPAATPAPAAPPPATPAPGAPDPTPIIVAVAQPEDAVAAFYANAAEGDFDAAYALWSDRMKATYPRQANLDERFDDTASITFHQLQLAGQDGGTAVVQANFTETYDSGGSREFVGYWELIRVDGRWLLDAPHY